MQKSDQTQQQQQTTASLVATKSKSAAYFIYNCGYTIKQNSAFLIRCAQVGTYYGMLLGCGVFANPLFRGSANSSIQIQTTIITHFFSVGFLSSAIPYALFVDNAPSKSARWSPQFNSIFSPISLGLCAWLGGHLYYPGNLIIGYEKPGLRVREFFRISLKCMIAFYRVHLPVVLGFSLFIGVFSKIFRERHPEEILAKEQKTAAAVALKEKEKEKTVLAIEEKKTD